VCAACYGLLGRCFFPMVYACGYWRAYILGACLRVGYHVCTVFFVFVI